MERFFFLNPSNALCMVCLSNTFDLHPHFLLRFLLLRSWLSYLVVFSNLKVYVHYFRVLKRFLSVVWTSIRKIVSLPLYSTHVKSVYGVFVWWTSPLYIG